jgi:O-antigen biosynthesis protein
MEFSPTFNFDARFKSDVTNWHKHFSFAFDLIRCLKPKLLVELGVHKGDSYFCFCESIKLLSLDTKCYGIDTWEGDQHSGLYSDSVYEEVLNYNESFFSSNSYLVRDCFEKAIDNFNNSSIDLLHIDGCHAYNAVSEDFNSWIKKVKTNGIVMLHDINIRHGDFGVWKLWEELKEDYPSIAFDFGCGLGVILNNRTKKKFSIGKYLVKESAMSFISNAYSISFDKKNFENKLKNLNLKNKKNKSQFNKDIENLNLKNKENESQIYEEVKDLKIENQELTEKNSYLSAKCLKYESTNEKLIHKNNQIIKELEDANVNFVEIKKNFNKVNISYKLLNNGNNLLADKVKRMQNSLSWRLTSPFRFFRRTCKAFLKAKDQDDFDPEFYLSLYPDVRNQFGSDYKKAYWHFKNFGKREGRACNALRLKQSKSGEYSNWIKKYDSLDFKSISALKLLNSHISKQPIISIILPVYKTKLVLLEKAICSVLNQIYGNWELCIIDDFSNDNSITKLIESYVAKDKRIKFRQLSENSNISAASNEGIKLATGDFIAFLDHDDELRMHSLLHIAEAVNKYPNIKLIYTDEDKIDEKGNRMDPFFKSDWNPDLILSQNYICHLLCIDRQILDSVDGFDDALSGCQDWDLVLRVTEHINQDQIFHIPKILYHWRKTEDSTSTDIQSKDDIVSTSIKCVDNCIKRRSIDARIDIVREGMNYFHIMRELPSKPPSVSILIPSRDNQKLLKNCVDSIIENTDYENFEIIIIDNDSKKIETKIYLDSLKLNDWIRVIQFKGEFNYSKINNFGVQQSDSEVILLLNDDTEIISPFWLTQLVSNCTREEIGCVGPKLLYPNKKIQHAGIVLGIGGVAGHQGKGEDANSTVNFSRFNLSQNCSAVTGACLAVRRKLYLKVGGLDGKNLKVAFNDVDFCIRISQLGFRNLYLASVSIFHHESFSRGSDLHGDNKIRFAREIEYMEKKWNSVIKSDPYYNPNLTIMREDFSLSFPPR